LKKGNSEQKDSRRGEARRDSIMAKGRASSDHGEKKERAIL